MAICRKHATVSKGEEMGLAAVTRKGHRLGNAAYVNKVHKAIRILLHHTDESTEHLVPQRLPIVQLRTVTDHPIEVPKDETS
jgi:hypothetical protein